MKDSTSIGMNRTGSHMSPFDTDEMTDATATPSAPRTPGDDSALTRIRSAYTADADPVGSVPVPGTVKGAVTTGVSMVTGNNPQLLIDKLGERLAFERTGARLYDALIAKLDGLQESASSMTREDLEQIRDDEARHFSIVKSAIESIGGDPTAQTPCADVTGVESMGLVQVVTDPRTSLAQSLHAILIAEMTDNAGWELLITLAEDNGRHAMVSDFTAALNEERSHLMRVRKWFEEAILGTSVTAGTIDEVGTPAPLH
ncbi:ferritin-like domain-containing protein [Noviherbaspirillum massiliense]|uniref:ferritin-like domain-containing protein n=1 Tax=Noviherbaspirillum massiliense TaxID=1465823 RepID=UPI000946F6E0|nr:ferritin-like domain-containing protein [Noviherbaspirillum massiliense]